MVTTAAYVPDSSPSAASSVSVSTQSKLLGAVGSPLTSPPASWRPSGTVCLSMRGALVVVHDRGLHPVEPGGRSSRWPRGSRQATSSGTRIRPTSDTQVTFGGPGAFQRQHRVSSFSRDVSSVRCQVVRQSRRAVGQVGDRAEGQVPVGDPEQVVDQGAVADRDDHAPGPASRRSPRPGWPAPPGRRGRSSTSAWSIMITAGRSRSACRSSPAQPAGASVGVRPQRLGGSPPRPYGGVRQLPARAAPDRRSWPGRR